MKIGDIVTNAIWVDGNESKEMRAQYEKDVTNQIDILCQDKGFIRGEVTFIEKRPDAEDVEFPVPDHIQGDCVRLLVAEAKIVEKKIEVKIGSFVHNLDKKDLQTLRKMTRKAHAKKFGTLIGNRQCDEIIEEIGPDAAVAALRTLH